MAFLYHRVPPNMQGEVLYPLNELRKSHPEVYTDAVAKYEGRESLLERRVPYLDCLWNDAVFLSPVPPKRIKEGLELVGGSMRAETFYRINANDLDIERCVTYLHLWEHRNDSNCSSNWEPFDPDTVERYASVPIETLRYYERKLKAGERPLAWAFTPHILHRGPIETRSLEVIEV